MNKYFRQRKVRKVRKRKEGRKGEKTNWTKKDEWTVTMPRRFMWGSRGQFGGQNKDHPPHSRKVSTSYPCNLCIYYPAR